jgi:hypothetical protein
MADIYNYKAAKYEHKYYQLKKKIGGKPNKNNKNAVLMLCMLKDHYVLAACIASFYHRKFIAKTKRNIELVVMCDDYIYSNYKNTLEGYFDRIVKIDLKDYGISKKYIYADFKYTWMRYSLDKWECMQYDEYDKLLFMDVDILPNDASLYDVFDFGIPCIHNVYSKKECKNGHTLNYDMGNMTYDDYLKNVVKKYGSLDGGIILFKPDKQVHREYYDFVKKLYPDGIYSIFGTGPDETSLFYYLNTKFKNVYGMCDEFSVTPWTRGGIEKEKLLELIKVAKSYNFISTVKPWTRPKFLVYAEESIWHDIYKIMPKFGAIEKLYAKTLVDTFNHFISLPPKKRERWFNLSIVEEKPDTLDKITQSGDKWKAIEKVDKEVEFDSYGKLNSKKIH